MHTTSALIRLRLLSIVLENESTTETIGQHIPTHFIVRFHVQNKCIRAMNSTPQRPRKARSIADIPIVELTFLHARLVAIFY